MKKIKILHVLTDTNIGGAGTLLINYLHCFNKDKYDISVCLPSGAALAPLVEAEGYRVISLEHGRDKSFECSAISEFHKLFKREKPDIVHTHSAFSAKLAAYLAGVKSRIYTRHCVFDMPKRLTSFPGKQINGFINNTLATRIVAVAEAARDNLIETGVDDKKITVIINGVMPVRRTSDEEKKELKKHLGISDTSFVAGIPARLEHYKGHSYLIEAVREIKEKYPNIVFLLMGEGSEEKRLKDMAVSLGVSDKIIFTGFVDDLAPYYNIMDLNLNCSYGTETSSLSLSEGMSLGIPAIATTFGGNPYMITEGVNGLLVLPKDSHAMAEAILKLLSDRELLKKLGEGAAEEYKKKFTAEAMTRQLEGIYDAEAKRIIKKK
ncbi:MAG: glycosyltransferase family 4 protein [Clostridia bacterium]|nr:glycosyltransferase family 4 protein [Clostridia bacterium]